MSPRLVASYFGGDVYERLARVLQYSARQHCPAWAIDVQAIASPALVSAMGRQSHADNTAKMLHWCAAVAAAPDGARIGLLDADTLIVNPLDDVWHEPFDLAYTTKTGDRIPINTGVAFVRVTPALRAFMTAWRDVQVRMLADRAFHHPWRRKYGGINQAALGYALETGLAHGIAVRTLPCAIWNCEDISWRTFDPATTRIVHIKSELRRAIFHGGVLRRSPAIVPLIRRWTRLEREALGVGVSV